MDNYYSIFIDKLALEEGDKQIYGTQVELIHGCPKLSQVMDPENLNERRKSLGLKPIEEYLKGFKCE
ncbi:DUF6624 domain-containing protein [Umezakia ovalisporum]|uniref:DUF6624 domain-containing protein n=1 Tax=Umezakia ovalisporum TaxID=75695 RepID=UPI0039C690EC